MIKCPYCEAENEDSEIFCEECGRPLKKPEKKKKIKKKYDEDSTGNFIYYAPSTIIIQDECEGVLKYPDAQSIKDGKWKLLFKQARGCNLADYLSDEENQKVSVIVNIEKRILEIFENIQRKKLIVGSCDLEDFFLIDENPEKMVFRVVRPLLSKENLPKDYVPGEFAAPEVKNENSQYIGERTDVYLAAIIFNRMIIKTKYSAGSIDAQLFWGYTLTNAAFLAEGKHIRRFHHWLGETLNMLPSKRSRKIKGARLSFEKCCNLELSRINPDIHIEDHLETNVGKGKKILMVSLGRKKDEWNEDSIEKWEKKLDNKKIRAYLLADGISNCDIGSGYLASNIIRENFKNVLIEQVDDSYDDVTYDMIENLAYEIVRRSNKDIWSRACEFDNQFGSIMGSTFVFIFIIGGVMYTYCIGDSPLYLIRKGNAIPLYSPDNVGYAALKKGMTYTEFRQMEGKDSIVLYVGGEYARNESNYYKQREVEVMTLQEDDIIIATSDGVLDYMAAKISDTDWDKEKALVKMLTKKEPISMIASHIISMDNRNGGGDNLSMILIKVGGESYE